MKRQQGFTLIELIVVIVILGILAATAMPKFVNLSSDARGGVMKGVEGSMRSANAIIYAKAAISGYEAAAASAVIVNGTTVTTAYGYASNASELAKMIDLQPTSDFNITTGAIQHNGAATKASCQVAYTAATGITAASGPAVTLTITDCN